MRKTCFNVEGHQVLERLPRDVAEFLCLEMLRLPGQGPWQPALADPASSRSDGTGDLQSSLPASAVL